MKLNGWPHKNNGYPVSVHVTGPRSHFPFLRWTQCAHAEPASLSWDRPGEAARGVLCRGRLGKGPPQSVVSGTPRSPSLTEQWGLSSQACRREPGSFWTLTGFLHQHIVLFPSWVFLSKYSLFMRPAIAPRPDPPRFPSSASRGHHQSQTNDVYQWHRLLSAKAGTVTRAVSKTENAPGMTTDKTFQWGSLKKFGPL